MSQQQPVAMGTPQVVYPVSQNQQTMAGQQQYFLPAQSQNSNGQTVIIRTVGQQAPKVWEKYKSRASIWLGGIQIAVGLLMILFNAIGLAVRVKGTFTMFMVGHGFWCAPMYLIAGGFGVGAGKHKTTCMIVTTMVMSIVSACSALGAVVTVSGFGLAVDRDLVYDYDYDSNTNNHQNIDGVGKTLLAMHGLMLILAVVEFVIAIVASALCCAVVCCGSTSPQVTAFHFGPGTMPLQTGEHVYAQAHGNASSTMAPTGPEVKAAGGAAEYMPVGDPLLPPSYSDCTRLTENQGLG